MPRPDPGAGPPSPGPDAGIATTSRLASEANRRATGPLGRPRRTLRNPLHAPRIDHASAEFGPVHREGDLARVRVVARESTPSRGGATGSWPTDGVMLPPVEMA